MPQFAPLGAPRGGQAGAGRQPTPTVRGPISRRVEPAEVALDGRVVELVDVGDSGAFLVQRGGRLASGSPKLSAWVPGGSDRTTRRVSSRVARPGPEARTILTGIDFLDQAITELSDEIERVIALSRLRSSCWRP